MMGMADGYFLNYFLILGDILFLLGIFRTFFKL